MDSKLKKIYKGIVLLSIISFLFLSSCSPSHSDTENLPGNSQDDIQQSIESLLEDSDFEKQTEKGDFYTTIMLADNHTTIDGMGAFVEGNTITLNKSRTYILQGTLSNGKINVNVDGQVHLILNGVNITCNDSAALSLFGKKKKVITLPANTQNYLTDASSYSVFYDSEKTEPNGAIFSKKALTFNGEGSLTVNGNYDNGISCKDQLKILGGNFTIKGKKNAVKGNSCVIIKAGKINATSLQGDGIKSDSELENEGFIYQEGGEIAITSANDGMQSYSNLWMKGGKLEVKAGNGANDTKKVGTDENSYKGIKSRKNILIQDGNIIIDSLDDCIHSDNTAFIEGGTFTLKCSAPNLTDEKKCYRSKGIHANNEMNISGGTINISSSYEGIESPIINILGGNISITSNDDGLNASQIITIEKTDRTAYEEAKEKEAEDCSINIKGGKLIINAQGDGIDSNGNIYFTGGETYIDGPIDDRNGALDCGDYNNYISVTGGILVACGSLGMAEIPSEFHSTQCVVSYSPTTSITNSTLKITNSSNSAILSYTPKKTWRNAVISSPKLLKNNTYTFAVVGSKPQSTQQKLNSTVTKIGASAGTVVKK